MITTRNNGIDTSYGNYGLKLTGINRNSLTAADFTFATASINDTLTGGANSDDLFGGLGNDTLSGLAGDDRLFGEQGDDRLVGGSGSDTFTGGAGNDTIALENFTGSVFARDLDIVTDFVQGQDKIDLSGLGISDFNTLLSVTTNDASNSAVITTRNNGIDTSYGNYGLKLTGINRNSLTAADFTFATAVIDNIIDAGANYDDLFGGLGNDTLNGLAGDDRLFGEQGNDTLNGGTGNDLLKGQSGIDTLTGGTGNDTFDLTGYDILGNADYAIVKDFTLSGDKLILSGAATDYTVTDTSPIAGVSGATIFKDTELIAIFESITAAQLTPAISNGTVTTFVSGATLPLRGVLNFSSPTYTTDENGVVTAAVTVTRTGGNDGVVSATVTPTNGTATAPDDYNNTPITVTFANGDAAAKTITIPVVADALVEPNETVNLTLASPVGGATIGQQSSATLTIIDRTVVPVLPQPGVLSFSSPTYSVNEDGTAIAAVTVIRTGGTQGLVSATVTPTNGTATAPDDYNDSAITVTFADGDAAAKIIAIPVVNDTLIEFNETVNLTLTAPIGGATIGTQNTSTLTIIDNDAIPLVASTANDPHLRTFDRLGYDFQAVGEFTLVKSTTDDFEIQTRQQPWNNSTSASANSAISINSGGQKIAIYADRSPKLVVNGTAVTLADGGTLAAGQNTITRQGGQYKIITANQDLIQVNDRGTFLNINLGLADNRKGKVVGLLGNNNGNSGDEFALRDGTAIGATISNERLYGDYDDSWRITQPTSLFDYAAGTDTNTFTNLNFPQNIVTIDTITPEQRASAELIARNAGITDPDILNDAIVDIILTNGAPEFIQGAIEQQQINTETITQLNLNSIINGTPQADNLTGTAGNNIINGLGGDDVLDGGLGDDQLFGGEGSDELYGSAGNDTLTGDAGDDGLYGGEGNDTLNGGLANDELVGDAGDDILDGGAGIDDLYGGEGSDELYGSAGNDTLTGDAGDDGLYGGEGNDILNGGLGNDELVGDAGIDVLYGGEGIDDLYGGEGNDILNGGLGNDILHGNGGANIFAFGSLNDGVDTIVDFSSIEDKLLFSATSFGGGLSSTAPLSSSQFITGSAATNAEQGFIYDISNGNLYFDVDGIGGAGQVQIATLSNLSSLGANNFAIV